MCARLVPGWCQVGWSGRQVGVTVWHACVGTWRTIPGVCTPTHFLLRCCYVQIVLICTQMRVTIRCCAQQRTVSRLCADGHPTLDVFLCIARPASQRKKACSVACLATHTPVMFTMSAVVSSVYPVATHLGVQMLCVVVVSWVCKMLRRCVREHDDVT